MFTDDKHIYRGSSSVLVLIASHSLCNSFVINQFLFFTPNEENSLCYTLKKQWEQYGGEKKNCLFFISKIYSHVTQKWQPKTGMAIPYYLCWKLLHTRWKYSDISVCKVATCKSTRKLISRLLSMSVHNNDGWKWALRTFHDLSRHETRVHFQLAQDRRCEPGKTLLP